MATQRSDKVYEYWHQSREKFDYFVTGITGALCAYVSQSSVPARISVSPNTLELLALLLLVGSVIAGFRRIEKILIAYRYDHEMLRAQEERGQLVSLPEGGTLVNKASGEILGPDLISSRIHELSESWAESEKFANMSSRSADLWYRVRNWLLGTGFLLLIASKVWAAYMPICRCSTLPQ